MKVGLAILLSIILLAGCIEPPAANDCQGDVIGKADSDATCGALCVGNNFTTSCYDPDGSCHCTREAPPIEEPTAQPEEQVIYNITDEGLRSDVNYTELQAGFKEERPIDADNDGLNNTEEMSRGTNPRNQDTDGDGLNDGDEIAKGTDPNKPDTDDDGLWDGAEASAGTDPLKKDTDSDGANDHDELGAGTNPRSSDSDGDGIADGDETDWNKDTDGDGKVNAMDTDSDDDGLGDADELKTKTDPLLNDTDGDSLSDYAETKLYSTDALKADTDADGLYDNLEGYTGRWAIKSADLTQGSTASETVRLRPGAYQAMAQAMIKSAASVTNLTITASGCAQQAESFTMPNVPGQNIPRWFATAPFTVANECDLTITVGVQGVLNATVALSRIAAAPESGTDPNDADTDDDGLMDGRELQSQAYWFEAEDYAVNASQILNKAELSNGKGVATNPADYGNKIADTPELPTPTPSPTPTITIGPRITATPGPTAYPSITPTYVPTTITSTATAIPTTTIPSTTPTTTPTAAYSCEWSWPQKIKNSAGTVVKTCTSSKPYCNNNAVKQNLAQCCATCGGTGASYACSGCDTATAGLFRLTGLVAAGMPDLPSSMVYLETPELEPGTYAIFIRGYGKSYPELDVRVEVDGQALQGKYLVDTRLSRGQWAAAFFGEMKNITFMVKNPSKATIELAPAIGSESKTFFVDEIVVIKMSYTQPSAMGTMSAAPMPRMVTNPQDPDTDGDQYRSQAPGASQCATNTVKGYLTDSNEADHGLNPLSQDSDEDGIADDTDPNPMGTDADNDGIKDMLEDTNSNARHDPNTEKTDWCDPDTDGDRALDGNEDWNQDGIRGQDETDPANADSDWDGLLDGSKIGSADLLKGDGYSYTVKKNSARFAEINASIGRIDYGARHYDPWIESGDSVTFIGEADMGSDPLVRDTDGDGLFDGVEAFVFKTSPAKADTDGDGYSDYDEIDKGMDPLRPDWPDLSVQAVTIDPASPNIDEGVWNPGKLYVEVVNRGNATANGVARVTATVDGRTVEASVQDIWPRGMATAEFDMLFTPTAFLAAQQFNNPDRIVLAPGNHDIQISIDTKAPPAGWKKMSEADYSNNQYTYAASVSGDLPPKAGIDASNILLSVGQSTTFSFWGSDPDGSIAKYEIDFDGDGVWDYTAAKAGTIAHTYTKSSYNGAVEGRFRPAIRATDNDGFTATAYSRNVTVFPPLDGDSDGDGLTDSDEMSKYKSNYLDADFDKDHLNDYQELVTYKTKWDNADSDSDGLRDDLEALVARFFGTEANADADGDNIPNILDADSDNDGIKDGAEFVYNHPAPGIDEAEYIYDIIYWHGTNPYYSDSDYDGLSDTDEQKLELRGALGRVHNQISPLDADSDNDGLDDYREVKLYGTMSNRADSDNDGLFDGLDDQPLSNPGKLIVEVTPYGVYNEHGLGWAVYYPEHMLRFTKDLKLFGMKGRSWAIWGDNEEITPEGVLDSDLSGDAVVDLGLGEGSIQVYDVEEKVPEDNYGTFTRTEDGWSKYRIEYSEHRATYTAHLWNTQEIRDPAGLWFTAWELGLAQGKDNSLKLQFRIPEGDDKYFIRGADYMIPAFKYGLYKKGADGLEMYQQSQAPTYSHLLNKGGPVLERVAQAKEIADHYYEVEIKIPKESISSGQMFIALSPAWLSSYDGMVRMDPQGIEFASVQKVIYYPDTKEVLRVGYDKFDDLYLPPVMPGTWMAEKRETPTSVRKVGADLYSVTYYDLLRKVAKPDGQFTGPHYILDRTNSTSPGNMTSAQLDSVMPPAKLAAVEAALVSSELDTVAAFDSKIAMMETPGGVTPSKHLLWGINANTGLYCDAFVAPALKYSIKHIEVKSNAVVGTVFFTIDIITGMRDYANAPNKILRQQAVEGMCASAIDFGLSFIPGYNFFDIGWRLVIYDIYLLFGLPDNVKLDTLSDPGALLVFAVEYLWPGSIPSDIAEMALMDAADVIMDTVWDYNIAGQYDDRAYGVFIPPS